MDGKLLGDRISDARKAADLTQEHLANRVGIDRTALGLIEKGKRKVSVTEMVDLAAALDVPLAWFVREPLPSVVSRRAEAGPAHELSARLDRELELFAGDLASLVQSGVIEAVVDRPAWTTPRNHDDAEKVAQHVREHLDDGTGPLRDIASVAERFGLYSCSLALGDGGADGALVEVTQGVAAAVIDGDTPPGRRRMSLAHELGHWLFGDAYDAGAGDAERMINSFAIYLLAPRAGVRQLWNEHPFDSARDRAIRVAATFRISWSAAVPHLLHLNLIGDEQRRILAGDIPVTGEFDRLQLPRGAEEMRPPSVSPGLTAAVLDAYADRRLTAARTLELLRGQLQQQEELPPQREETAADYAHLFQSQE